MLRHAKVQEIPKDIAGLNVEAAQMTRHTKGHKQRQELHQLNQLYIGFYCDSLRELKPPLSLLPPKCNDVILFNCILFKV